MKCSTIRCENTAMQCSRIIEQTCTVAQSGQRSSAALALHLQDLYCVSYWYPCPFSVFLIVLKVSYISRNLVSTQEIRIAPTKYHSRLQLDTIHGFNTGDDHLMIIVWSSDCHLIAIRWSLLRPVWYHGWIVAQSSDHDAVAGVSVVTLVALLTLGTFGNHASAPPETQHKSSAPCFRPDIRKCCLPSLVISQRQWSSATPKHSQVQTSASAIIVGKYFVCGRALTNRMTNAHPESQHKSLVPKVIYDFRSLHEICGFC